MRSPALERGRFSDWYVYVLAHPQDSLHVFSNPQLDDVNMLKNCFETNSLMECNNYGNVPEIIFSPKFCSYQMNVFSSGRLLFVIFIYYVFIMCILFVIILLRSILDQPRNNNTNIKHIIHMFIDNNNNNDKK